MCGNVDAQGASAPPAIRVFKPDAPSRFVVDANELSLRSYDPRDDAAVWALHEWAMRETGVDPSDIPGTDDLRSVAASYLDAGGAFVVGVVDAVDADQSPDDPSPERQSVDSAASRAPDQLATHDGTLAAMGGYVPNEAGHGDERDRPGAAELHRMRVAPPYQRRGYGRALLDELERRAASGGFETLLATTSTRQPAALDFYASRGYERTDTSTAGAYELVHFEKEL
ncbi:GNAT family N-acetyltransferase [Halorubrum ezzemoulense]|nr:GNAT family N-acetyltransferase [Halorubrum ezzemoulense]MDB9278929.1 GNAT family N-acetyltransferase [Halorubrum ezzemoulense]MDB9281871.1 GNAT family N-acetyltransferase [Halorubrum ezzemoulense]